EVGKRIGIRRDQDRTRRARRGDSEQNARRGPAGALGNSPGLQPDPWRNGTHSPRSQGRADPHQLCRVTSTHSRRMAVALRYSKSRRNSQETARASSQHPALRPAATAYETPLSEGGEDQNEQLQADKAPLR